MNANRYKVIGFLAWRVGKWYVRRTYGGLIPSRRTASAASAAAVVLGVGAAALLSGRGNDEA